MAEYRFRIEAFTPDTIPMYRLAEYMADFAALLGEERAVHFAGLEDGTTKIVGRVEDEAVPRADERIYKIQRGEAPREAMDVSNRVNRRLKEDNTSGSLQKGRAEIIRFPGKDVPEPISFGAVNQPGSLDGIVIVLGGKVDPVPVHIEAADKSRIYLCDASRTLAKELAKHFIEDEIRVHGTGRWIRDDEGTWKLERFHISHFEVLNVEPLSSVVAALRAINGNDWNEVKDPWGQLDLIRNGPRERN